MTVEENLFMGGYLLLSRQAAEATERIFDTIQSPRTPGRVRRHFRGERRILELSRADHRAAILLVDEPSIGLEPRHRCGVRYAQRLQRVDGLTVVIVEQNVGRPEFADVGYVPASGRVALADRAERLLENPRSAAFLGG
jgi:branched-chain amino acid transport system ATP-binding protein